MGAESETDPGLYIQWGETDGHTQDSGYDFNNNNYIAKGLNAISTNLTSAQDAVNVRLGVPWRTPNKTDFEELINHTNVTPISIKGVAGFKFTNKTDASKYIFMPAAGYYNGQSLMSFGEAVLNWSSTYTDSSNATCFNADVENKITFDYLRYYGCTVRAVC